MHLSSLILRTAAVSLFTAAHAAPVADTSSYRYLTDSTQQYLIKSLPLVDFDFGEMYGGNIPIDESEPENTLYFIYKPASESQYQDVKEVVIWLNGGPGCSSLGGFLQENGPILWQPGQNAPMSNFWAWSNITNMIWVDQPVGTGFSTGKVNATGEVDIAQQFIGFFKNWEKKFGISNYKIYVTGESYAGRYVPYISAAMLDAKDTTYYDLQGALAYDPVIGSFQYTQESVVTYPFLVENNNNLGLTPQQLSNFEEKDTSCGYAALRDKYLTFPPPGHQPAHGPIYTTKCDVWGDSLTPISELNPCFNIYEINQQCPELYNPLGFGGYTDGPVYFDRADVVKAIHAPTSVTWKQCGERKDGVFDFHDPPGPENEKDAAPDPIQGVLPQVIDGTKRVLIGNGDLDMIIITNGTLMAIQNMTWGGELGFQSRPSTPIDVKGSDFGLDSSYNQGVIGVQHYERGLMWVETYLCGHMQPEFQPRVTLLHLEWVLGRRDTI